MNLSTLVRLAIDHSETGDFHLEHNPELIGTDGAWGASVDCFKEQDYICGKTPEEAVKKLLRTLTK
jgi:light-regulated signal transduction histidine kinase (bacteriophytochrome)